MSDSLKKALKQMRQAAENLSLDEHDHGLSEEHREMARRARLLLLQLTSAIQLPTAYPVTGRAQEFDFWCQKVRDGKKEQPGEEIYLITRDCCTSGNCSTCIAEPDHKYGDKVRCVQFVTRLKAMADKVAKNWAGYGAKIEEPNEAVIGSLCQKAQDWVRATLAKPEMINNKMITAS